MGGGCSTDNQGGLFSEPGKPPKLTSYFRFVPCLPLPGSLWLFFPPCSQLVEGGLGRSSKASHQLCDLGLVTQWLRASVSPG